MINIEPNAAALRTAAMAPLLHRPISEAAQRLSDDLYKLTVAREAALHPRKRKRQPDAQESLRATIGALARDLLKASGSP